MEEVKIPKWARDLHNEHCSWKDKCSDNQIEINPKCRECGEFEEQSVAHKGENTLCKNCWNKKMKEIY